MRVCQLFLGSMVTVLAASSMAAQTPVLGEIETPYPALKSHVRIAGQTFPSGVAAYGPAGTPLTLSGSGFGASGIVQFTPYTNGVAGTPVQASVATWNSTVLFVTVPTGATSGLVTVSTGGQASNGLPFVVTPGQYAGSCPASPPNSQLEVVTASLGDGMAGQAYSATLVAAGGTQAYSWAITGGSLPGGLSLNASTGVISGTPSGAAGPMDLTVQVADSSSPQEIATAVLSLTIASAGNPEAVYSYSIPSSGGYDSASNILSYTDSVTGTWSMTNGYDDLNRLTAASATAGPYQGMQVNWSYDSFGNRTSENFSGTLTAQYPPPIPASSTAAYNANNQIQSANPGPAPSYDAAGNVSQDNQNQYLYDADGQICAIKNLLTGQMVGYLYDAEGTRIAKGNITNWSAGCDTTQNGFTVTVSYILTQGNEQLTELTWSGGTAQWASTNVFADGQVAASYSADPSGDTVGILNFYLTDWLGTRRAMTDYAGNIQETCDSLPYGNGENCYPSPTERLFTQHERDAETGGTNGNDYFGARYYASSAGRFLSPDWDADPNSVPYATFADPQSLNLYSYVLNNPFTRMDRTGHLTAGNIAQNQVQEFFCSFSADFCNYAYDVFMQSPKKPSQTEAPELAFGEAQEVAQAEAAQQQNGQAVATVYNETGGLRPDASSDPNSAQNLQTARKNVAHVYKNTHGRGFQSLRHLTARARAALRGGDPDAVAAYDSSRSAVNAAYHDRTDPTGGANHIYLYDLSPNSSQHVPSWVTNGNPTTVEGPFINAAGGGDVRAGDLVLILTIKDQ
jgi:RHS repeat-associated protein